MIKNLKEEIAIIRQRDPAIHSSMEVLLYPALRLCCITGWPISCT